MKKAAFLALATTCLMSAGTAFTPAMAQEEDSPWLVRLRGINVMPDESSTVSAGGAARVDNSFVPELDITYFWSKHWSTELILAVTNHNVRAEGTALGDLDLGDKWLLPPTLTLQYNFAPDADIRPYVGAGVNYTIFFGGDAGQLDSVKYDDGFGFALQAGVDFMLDDNWGINLDVKRLWLNTDVNLNSGLATADVDLDPWILGAGLSYRF
jgi:outer membrane protein